jgi:peptide/nickel transport system permease protein
MVLLRRLGLSLTSLVLLSIIVFLVVQVLPGDVGRRMLGPMADQLSVDKLNHVLGVDRPALVQYGDWARHFVEGNFGTSFIYEAPVAPFVIRALANSALLAAAALVISLPLSIGLGIYAGRSDHHWSGSAITISSVAVTAIPEFVTGVVLLLLLGVVWPFFPTSADAAADGSWPARLWALVLPATTIALSICGYLTRMILARAREVYQSDYVRFARTQGSSELDVFKQNVFANSTVPTIPVIATQIGYMMGSLTVVELLFNYNGIGLLILNAAKMLDLPMLMAGVLTSGLFFMGSIAVGDMLVYFLEPRRRHK